MSDDRRKLGKGLGAIFGDDVINVLDEIQQGTNPEYSGTKVSIALDDILVNPYQPRRHFDEVKLQELAESIQQHGLFTPVLVRQSDHGYQLVAGERRLRATRLAGLTEITAIVVELDDESMMEIAIIENVQREDLNVIEEAQGYQTLGEKLKLTQEEIASKVNKSRTHITNLLRLLKLPKPVQEMVMDQKLTMGQVRPLVVLEDPKQIQEIANRIVKENLSARQVEALLKGKPPTKEAKETTSYDYPRQLLEHKLQTRVEVAEKRIVIHFDDQDDLNRILETLDLLEKE